MRKFILGVVFILAGAVNAFGQSTTVSGTVTDAGSQAWAGGTFQFQFVPNPQFPTGPYTWTGGTLNKVISGSLDGSGHYSQSVPSNSAISPQGSKWILQVTPNATWSSFSTSGTTITGGTQTLNVTPPAISINLSSSPSGSFTRAYTDAEITTAPLGGQYYNVTSSAIRLCTFVSGSTCTTWVTGGGGGGGICPAGAATDVQTTDGTNCAGSNTFTSDGAANVAIASTGILPASLSVTGAFANFLTYKAGPADGTTFLNLGGLSGIASPVGGGHPSFYGDAQAFVPAFNNITSLGAPLTVVGLFTQAQDGTTALGEVNGQTLIGGAFGIAMRKNAGGTIVSGTGVMIPGPGNDTGMLGVPAETATNIFGLDIKDQHGVSTTEQSAIKIRPQTTPGAGAKWSIKADSGSGIANFGDGIDDGTLTSGRCVQAGANGRLTSTATACPSSTAQVRSLQVGINGGGGTPTTGVFSQISIPYSCTLTGWVITADQSGSAVVDVLRSTFSGFPTTSSIAGTDKPTLSSAQKNQDLTLTGWGSTAITAGDILQFNLNSATTVTTVYVTLNITVP